MDEGEVLEGFLCPICVVDLKTAVQLNSHFQEQHSDDQDLFKSVKDMYEKAKKKMYEKTKKKDQAGASESDAAPGPVLKSTPGYRPSPVNLELGASRNHTEYFKSVRTFRMERYAAQTNNLLIRLDKLLINLPSDPVKRKAHEQKVVPWLNEKDVSLCPGCAKQFGLLRRKHHCRLCGAVMCNECTCLLALDTARKMTNTSVASNATSETSEHSYSKESTPVKKLLKSPSSASVQSVLSLDLTNESFFRLCTHCHKLLEIRQKLKEVRNQKPIICQFYEKLRNAISETDPLLATYTKMYNSLCAGETTYSLIDAQGVRVKILRLADIIDNISKKIAILGQNTENPPQGSQLLLQKSVRDSAAHYLKENIITLPSLPTEEQIQHYQEQRRLEMARKIEQAHEAERLALESELRNFGFETRNRNSYIPASTPSSSAQDAKVVVEVGWTPDVNVAIVSDNPIIQQMNIIRGFIKQAKLANKLDEVAILEDNLRELKEALYKQNEEKNRETLTSQD